MGSICAWQFLERCVGTTRRWRVAVCLAVALGASGWAAEEAAIASGGEPVSFTDLRCVADGVVVATASVGADGAVLRSADGGLNWSVVRRGGELSGVRPNFIELAPSTPGAGEPLRVTGYRHMSAMQFESRLGPLLESGDGGQTWVAASAVLPAQLRTNDAVARAPSPVVVDSGGRLAVARLYPDPVVLLSDDRGASWVERRVPGIDTSLFGLASNGRGRLVAVGAVQPLFGSARLVISRSDDSGRTWATAMDEPADHLACSPRLVGLADAALMVYNPCRDRGKRYYLSDDGGRSWVARVFGPGRGAFEQVVDLGGNRWVALSQEGPERSVFAWTSDNGGQDWRGQPTGVSARSGNLWLHMQTLVPLAGGTVIAYVGDAQVLRSDDRGNTWKAVDTGLPRRTPLFMAAACTDGKGLVVLAGGQGMLVRSTDAGLTWQRGRAASTPP